ncbi:MULTISPECIES: sugar transferase [Jannaschia]|uniref:sugar transferase n=1 Tax=Jannaschia TaxID=188905 RepID=UPI002104DD9C|nr:MULTISPECIES: sugar transferase [unclassified Jannaschia]
MADFAKVFLDRATVGLGLLAIAPLLLVIAAVILILDGRPIFFGHERVGREGKSFKCWKFRTMVRNAEERLQFVLENDPKARAEWEETQKLKNDPRILPFGRVLRDLSIDELPQLWNVLRGDMSLVGPRPVTRGELAKYGPDRTSYLAVRPGLTGEWQVSGRSSVSFEERVAMDVEYVAKRSLVRDLTILLRTPAVVVKKTGAC